MPTAHIIRNYLRKARSMAISASSGLKSPYRQMIAPVSASFGNTVRQGSALPPGSMHTCPTIFGILSRTRPSMFYRRMQPGAAEYRIS